MLVGPKAVGKTTIARLLRDSLGIEHVDADTLVVHLLSEGRKPSLSDGWMPFVLEAIIDALEEHNIVVFEATGAYPSDWKMADEIETRGVRLTRIWVHTDLMRSLCRLRDRNEERAPTSPNEAQEIYTRATQNALNCRFEFSIDTSEPLDEGAILRAVKKFI